MLRSELRQALRGLARRPAFTATAVITLALGIGANTAIFSAVWHLLLAPLPFANGDRMGFLWDQTDSGFQVVPSPQQAEAFLSTARTLERIEPYSSATFAYRASNSTETVQAGRITNTMPATLGVPPLLGRAFDESETLPGGPAVALVSQAFWQTRLGGVPDVLGLTLRLDGRTFEIVGVMPDRFARYDEFGLTPEIWVPLIADGDERANLLVIHGEGVTPEQVGAELTAISANIPEARLGVEQPRTRMAKPRDMLGESTRRALVVLLAAVAIVLLIACANVAGLLLVRGSGRRRELAIRAALGARRPTLIRHLLIESLVLALGGGVIGLLLGAWGIDLIRSVRPSTLSELDAMALDPMVLGFTAVVTALTAAVFGLLPALHAARVDLRTQFSASSTGSTGSPDGSRTGGALVIGEVALAVVLLVGALLLVRTMASLQNEPLGFDAAGRLAFSVSLPEDRYPDNDSWRNFGSRLADELTSMPGVASATLSTGVPPRFGIMFGELRLEGRDDPVGDGLISGAEVDADYFRTLGITLLEGRGFDGTAADDQAVLVNRSTAERLWPGESAVGKRILLGSPDRATPITVIGVTPDVAVGGPLTSFERPQLFRPIRFSYPAFTAALHVRSGDPLTLAPAVRAAVERIDSDLPLRNMQTIEHMLEQSIGRQRFNMILFSAFAGLAMILAMVGLYGIVAYSVSHRTRELGIRVALGAQPHGVQRMVLLQGAALCASGALLGTLVALRTTRYMARLLHEVEPYDPASFAAAILLVFMVSVLATWVPARRASRVDPLVALKSE